MGDESIRPREFEAMNARMKSMEDKMGLLAEHYAAINVQLREMERNGTEQRRELREELSKDRREYSQVLDFVKAMMVPGGLLNRLDRIENDATKDRTQTKVELTAIHSDLQELKDFSKWLRTWGAALGFVVGLIWVVFGDLIKRVAGLK